MMIKICKLKTGPLTSNTVNIPAPIKINLNTSVRALTQRAIDLFSLYFKWLKINLKYLERTPSVLSPATTSPSLFANLPCSLTWQNNSKEAAG